MKKQLLLSSALLIAVSAFSQNGRIAKPAGATNTLTKMYINVNENSNATKSNSKSTPISNLNYAANNTEQLVTASTTTINWNIFSGSSNTYGMTISSTKPLQYNYNVNAVSFVHRASATYIANAQPVQNSGVIVAEISTNWGTSWDSTCVYSAGPTPGVGRYPQGGIYNPVGNTNIANSYIVATGPANDFPGSNWVGNFYASKQLGAANYNYTASAVPNAMQLLSNQSAVYTNTAQFGPQLFSYGYSSTDDGRQHAICPVFSNQQTDMRNVKVVRGDFSAGVFNWTTDSLNPSLVVEPNGTTYAVSTRPTMAWNQSGTIGYALMIGALSNATLSNRGFQPIVFKTTNSGVTWAQTNTIDFNSAAMLPIKNKLYATNSNTNLIIPYFGNEGFDCVVDANNKLHIVGTLASTFDKANDSIKYTSSFTTSIDPNNSYSWSHTPGDRPYLYDFIGDGSAAWTVTTIDSLSSEGPTSQAAAGPSAGFNSNPWDANPTNKLEIDSRIQAGRTPNGQFITYAWAESDSNITSNKWNSIPNIKTRLMDATTGIVSNNEINVSKPSVANIPNVSFRATLHYLSPVTSSAVVLPGSTYTVDIKTPLTITNNNNNPLTQLSNNQTWYSSNTLSYLFTTTGLMDNNKITNSSTYNIFPNPTKNSATLAVDVKENTTITVGIYNIVGALVKTVNANAIIGANTVNLDLTNLTSGIYMVKVKVGNAVSTKKLVVE